VIEAQDRMMSRVAAPVVSDYIERRHLAEGVTLRRGVTISDVARADGGAFRLRMSDGAELVADVVVVGVGVIPNGGLAEACGLETSQGAIVVDEYGRTSDPAIFAAGEVTLHYNALHGRHERQETWAHAVAHGYNIGRCIAGAPAPYAEVSSYWSDQYDMNLQVFGAAIGERDIVRGDPASGRFLVFHVSGGVVMGVSAVNSVRELRVAKKLIGRPAPADVTALADPSAPLAEFA
jgi:NADPH-dependent 2,4-dienoyl-CoA reductase/sulfur reductase-like enzyme